MKRIVSQRKFALCICSTLITAVFYSCSSVDVRFENHTDKELSCSVDCEVNSGNRTSFTLKPGEATQEAFSFGLAETKYDCYTLSASPTSGGTQRYMERKCIDSDQTWAIYTLSSY